MNIDELKKLVKHSTAILVLDNGEPAFTILSYDMYKDLVLNAKEKEIKINNTSTNMANGLSHGQREEKNELEILERINKDILALKSEIEKEERVLSSNIGLD